MLVAKVLHACIVLYLVLVVNSQTCPESYLRFSDKHTYCKPPNTQCHILQRTVSQEDIAVILREHNAYRSRVATGKEKIQNLPGATNMMQIEWDPELAKVAEKHAEQCIFEHDCNACRMVENFSVGQNLYESSISFPAGAKNIKYPKTDWVAAIKAWYDEVKYFSKNYINPFMPSHSDPTYGHFTQVVWAESWKIGCGYTLISEGTHDFRTLYTCNYGPAGNMQSGVMYKKGAACTGCPVNSCCDKSCTDHGSKADYPGLCKMLKNEAPTYPVTEEAFFRCSFTNEPDCAATVEGTNKWKIIQTLSGAKLRIILNGGESSTYSFTKPLKAKASTCIILQHHRGPNRFGEVSDSTAGMVFAMVTPVFKVTQPLPASPDFQTFKMSLNWGSAEVKFSVTFSVPAGRPPQFFEVKNIVAKEGPCK